MRKEDTSNQIYNLTFQTKILIWLLCVPVCVCVHVAHMYTWVYITEEVRRGYWVLRGWNHSSCELTDLVGSCESSCMCSELKPSSSAKVLSTHVLNHLFSPKENLLSLCTVYSRQNFYARKQNKWHRVRKENWKLYLQTITYFTNRNVKEYTDKLPI